MADALLRPLGLLAELTHRCPLGCPYCSNPLALEPRTDELETATWARVFQEAAGLGVLQVHLSGGEPGRDRPCPILRLGDPEPRHADADQGAGRARGWPCRSLARAPSRHHRHRCGGP